MAEKDSTNPLWLAVAALLIPQCFGLYQEHNKFELERAQFEAELLKKAIDPNDRKKTVEAVRFLTKAGFITEEKVLRALQDSSLHISSIAESTPAPAPSSIRTFDTRPTFSGIVTDAMTHRPLTGATVSASAGGMTEQMVTGKDGQFQLHYPSGTSSDRLGRRAKPASWTFAITRPGYETYRVWEISSLVFPAKSKFALSPIKQETTGEKLFD